MFAITVIIHSKCNASNGLGGKFHLQYLVKTIFYSNTYITSYLHSKCNLHEHDLVESSLVFTGGIYRYLPVAFTGLEGLVRWCDGAG